MSVETINADLLSCDADLIVQQCNTVTRRSHGLSAAIAARFPYADVYARRSGQTANTTDSPDVPGTAVFCQPPDGTDGPIVACLMAQLAPGKPGAWCKQYGIRADSDSAEQRLLHFQSALAELADHIRDSDGKIKAVAFPHGIGCGLAGGKWQHYERAIETFAFSVRGLARVFICKLRD